MSPKYEGSRPTSKFELIKRQLKIERHAAELQTEKSFCAFKECYQHLDLIDGRSDIESEELRVKEWVILISHRQET